MAGKLGAVSIVDPESTTIFEATGAGAGESFRCKRDTTFQATSDASHTGTSTIDIEVSNDGTGWQWKGTISVTGNSDSAGFALNEAWKYVRANCTAHGDSTNVVTVTMGG